ncbi:hypothetical protein D3C80_882290 [compost metagenome]
MSRGIEFQFCSEWTGWDVVDTFALQFYEVTLLPEVAAIVGRDKVDTMSVCCETCKVGFWCEDGFEKTLEFKAQIIA